MHIDVGAGGLTTVMGSSKDQRTLRLIPKGHDLAFLCLGLRSGKRMQLVFIISTLALYVSKLLQVGQLM